MKDFFVKNVSEKSCIIQTLYLFSGQRLLVMVLMVLFQTLMHDMMCSIWLICALNWLPMVFKNCLHYSELL